MALGTFLFLLAALGIALGFEAINGSTTRPTPWRRSSTPSR
jgi:hypothetical protein